MPTGQGKRLITLTDAATIAPIEGVDAVFGTVDYTTKLATIDAVANLALNADGTINADANTATRQTLMSKSTMQQPLLKSKGVDAVFGTVDYTTKGVQRCSVANLIAADGTNHRDAQHLQGKR